MGYGKSVQPSPKEAPPFPGCRYEFLETNFPFLESINKQIPYIILESVNIPLPIIVRLLGVI